MDKVTQENLLALVKRNYEEIAEDFAETRKKYLWPELIKLAGMVKDGDRVLDAGCGSGRLIRAFNDKKINYLGVDSSEKLILVARKNLQTVIARSFGDEAISRTTKQDIPEIASLLTVARNDNNNFKFQVGDILALDKMSEQDFDYVFCIAVLHHLPGIDSRVRALEQMKNKLSAPGGSASGRKPASAGSARGGGKIIITVWNLWSQIKFMKLILKYAILKVFGRNKMDFGDILFNWKNNAGEPVSRRYYHAFTKSKFKKIAKRAGLKLEKLYKDKYNYYAILEK